MYFARRVRPGDILVVEADLAEVFEASEIVSDLVKANGLHLDCAT